MRKEILYASIGALYVAAQILTAIRVESFPLFPEPYDLVPAGVFAYLAIFLVANIINEKEGKKEGWKIIAAGLFANVLLLINLYLELAVPDATERGFGSIGTPLALTFSHLTSIEVRIVFGSVIAFVVAMYLNNYLYHKWKWNIWARYGIILILVMTIDTLLFHTIAFAGIFSTEGLLGSIASVTVFKIILTLVSIPIFALGLKAYGWTEFLETDHESTVQSSVV
ncbi:MAG: queuosine precursor transporter [Thermoplasmata archaeon]|nr:queuosine precursor transporter [Thermoplasmata archaeon]